MSTSTLDRLRALLDDMKISHAIDDETRLSEDLGLDSMRRIELAIEVENRFEIILEPEDEEAIETVGDLCRMIDTRRERSGP